MTTHIVEALAAGAKAAASGLAATAVKDAYAGLKAGVVTLVNRKAVHRGPGRGARLRAAEGGGR